MNLEHFERIAQADTVRAAWSVMLDALDHYGFDRALYVSTRFRSERSIGDLQDALLLAEHEPDYVHAMFERRLLLHTPMVQRLEPGGRVWRGDDAPAGGIGSLVGETRERLGLVAGCDLVLREPSRRSWGAVELCARPGLTARDVDGIWSRWGHEIELTCNLAHLKISHLPSWAGRRPLTEKQRRVLHWASEGKTAQETGIILSLSAATVEKHLRLARETLDVQTTAQAIAKAARWNQLFIEDDLDAA